MSKFLLPFNVIRLFRPLGRILLLGILFWSLAPDMSAQTFSDPGFGSELVTTLPAYGPVGVLWAPDGRMFIWMKNGVIRIFKNGVLLPTPFMDISFKVSTYLDNGVWGFAFDPNFEQNGYIYMSYVVGSGSNPNDPTPTSCRLIRVQANPANPDVMLAASETILMDNLVDVGGTHAAGGIRFAPDGHMFFGNGDGAYPNGVDPNAFAAQDLNSPSGKIFRLNPDGTAPSDNPFYDGTDSIRSKVWCYGVRNPYRFSVHPVTGEPYFADVGWNTWEEINHAIKGANYGWPCYEGMGPQPLYQGQVPQCASVSSVTPPIWTYNHTAGDLNAGGGCLVGGDFYRGSVYPQPYQGNYFFADYSGHWIHRLMFDASGNVTGSAPFATEIYEPTCIEQGPDGMLYYVLLSSGEIRRIRYNGPIAVASASVTYGYSPLNVAFSSAGSTNSGGGSLTYSWNFGDGATSTLPNPTHTYASGGVASYNATLTIRNAGNLTSSSTVRITVGSVPPTPTILSPASGSGFSPGQTVTYQGSATDPEDGSLPAASLNWTVLLHHNTHVHTFSAGTGSQGSFLAEDHGTIGTFSYEIILTATDSSGLSASTSIPIAIVPDITPPTAPSGLTAASGGVAQVALSWNPSTDNAAVAGYYVERQGGSNPSFVQIGTTQGTTFNDSGLDGNTTYAYRVQAVDASGNLSSYSGTASATTPPVIPGLVVAYGFNEGSGSTGVDQSGKGNNGSIGTAAWITSGKFGGALSFNGSSRVTVPDSGSLDLSNAMTLEAWMYPTVTASSWSTAIMKERPGNFDYILYAGSPANLPSTYIDTPTERGVSGSSGLPINIWSHLAATYDGTILRLYVNGNQVGSAAVSGSLVQSTGPLTIGGNAVWGEYFRGNIDEVRIYNRALTAAEIQNDMTTPIGQAAPNNTPPTISTIANQTINEDTPSAAIAFTVGDTETAAGSLGVSGSSSNPTLVPNANITFGGSAGNRTVTLTPAANQNGTANITVSVTDGSATASTTFLLTVNPVNDRPTISAIPNQTTTMDTPTAAIPFVIGDMETSASGLIVSGTSSNPALVPDATIIFGGSASNRTVTVTPAAAQTGTATITVAVSDGGLSASSSFVITVLTVNTPPTISTIADQVTNEDTPTAAISFTLGDGESAASTLTVSGSSSNPALVPNANLAFGGSGSNRTITLTPAANQFGTATITVSVSDGALITSTSFLLTVNTVNDTPTISAIGNQSTTAGVPTAAIPFTIADVETPPGSLAVTGSSGNQTLVPNANITFGGSGANRTVTVTPASGQTGTANITITVSDGSASANSSFTLTVNPAQTAGLVAAYAFGEGSGPTVADASGNANNGTIGTATWTTAGKFGSGLSFNGSSRVTINDANSLDLTNGMTLEAWIYPTAAASGWSTAVMKEQPGDFAYALYAGSPANQPNVYIYTSGEQGFAAPNGLSLNTWSHLAATYDGASLRMYVNGTQIANSAISGNMVKTTGALSIGGNGIWGEYFRGNIDEVRVYNRALTAVEIQTDMATPIGPVGPNTPPTISAIVNQTANEDTPGAAIAFTVGDAETAVGSLTVNGSSSNPTLVPNANLVFGGSGANRTLTITPAANQNGTATITVSVSDGSATTSTNFLLTVNSVNDAPTISSIANQSTAMNTPTAAIPFVVGDVETPAASLPVSGTSSNPTLVPDANIAFGGSGSNRTVIVTPASGQTGTASITVAVSDGGLSASNSFTLTVIAGNTPPTISAIADQVTNEDTPIAGFPFTVGDGETAPGSLTISGSSSNPTLVPNANLTFGGTGANRTLTIAPAANQFGTATITVSVSDGSLTASSSFLLTVNSVNDAPTISAIPNQSTIAGTPTAAIPFTVGDVESAAGSLIVNGSSSNQVLVPNGNIAFGGSGANRTVIITPAAGQTGTASITVSVSDGSLTASASFTLTVNAAQASGLVAAYSFNEGTGPTANDTSGNGNTGTIGTATWTAAGKFGNALTFNGSSRVTVNDANSLDLTNGMTLEAWIFPTTGGSGWNTAIMKEQPGDFAYALYAGSPANQPNAYIFTTGEQGFAGPSALPLNTWSHLAMTYDGANLRLYVNGAQVASGAVSGNMIKTTGALSIGGNSVWGEYFRGSIDEVRIYNRALVAAEIQTDMARAIP